MSFRLTKYILSILLAAGLVVSLVYFSGITFAQFTGALTAISAWQAAAMLGCTGFFILLSSLKWRMVMRAVGQPSARMDAWLPYVFYTSLGAALSIVLTVHLSVAITRALGARVHFSQSPAMGAGASVYEQMFDVGVLFLFAIPAVAALAFGLGPAGWLLAAAAATVLTATLIAVMADGSRAILARLCRLLAARFGRFGAAAGFFASAQSQALFAPAFVLRMLAISCLRYLVLMLRAFLVLWATLIPIAGTDFLSAFPIVQLSQIVAITPGGLGISEWTWSGVLAWLGHPASVVVQFALVSRVVNALTLVAFFACVAAVFLLVRGARAGNPETAGD